MKSTDSRVEIAGENKYVDEMEPESLIPSTSSQRETELQVRLTVLKTGTQFMNSYVSQ